jgi:hypothetical protein
MARLHGMGMHADGGGILAVRLRVEPGRRCRRKQADGDAGNGVWWICACGAEKHREVLRRMRKPAPTPESGSAHAREEYREIRVQCGKPRAKAYRCSKSAMNRTPSKPIPKFCPECGDPIGDEDLK